MELQETKTKKTKKNDEIIEENLILFKILLDQKFLTLDLIRRRFAPQELVLKQGSGSRLKQKIHRFIKSEHLKRIQNGLYALGKKGLDEVAALNPYGLPLISDSDTTSISHDLAAASIRFYLEKLGATRWVADRVFRHQTIKKIERIPDGACLINGHVVFIEIEFTQKSQSRYQDIFKDYSARPGRMKVLYFYKTRPMVDSLILLAAANPRFGFFQFAEDLPDPGFLFGCSAGKEISLETFLAP